MACDQLALSTSRTCRACSSLLSDSIAACFPCHSFAAFSFNLCAISSTCLATRFFSFGKRPFTAHIYLVKKPKRGLDGTGTTFLRAGGAGGARALQHVSFFWGIGLVHLAICTHVHATGGLPSSRVELTRHPWVNSEAVAVIYG